jgi:Ala-tRNA(Pro) deacylase
MIPASISEYLERNHAQYSVLSHSKAYTARQEAAAAHVPANEWAKTVVCFADDEPVLAVVPAPCAVDLKRLRNTVHAHSIRLGKEPEFAALYRDCEVGAMPPLGPLYGQRVYVDERLAADPEIVFSAGSHQEAIRMPYREFERLAQPTLAQFASGPSIASMRRPTIVTDTVCGARIEENRAAGWSQLRGETYYFCSQSCKMEFDDNPHAYARERIERERQGDEVPGRAGISNRLSPEAEARDLEEHPPIDTSSPPPEDAAGRVGEQPLEDRRDRQTSHKAGSRSIAQKEAGARYPDRSMPPSRKVPGAFGREPETGAPGSPVKRRSKKPRQP